MSNELHDNREAWEKGPWSDAVSSEDGIIVSESGISPLTPEFAESRIEMFGHITGSEVERRDGLLANFFGVSGAGPIIGRCMIAALDRQALIDKMLGEESSLPVWPTFAQAYCPPYDLSDMD